MIFNSLVRMGLSNPTLKLDGLQMYYLWQSKSTVYKDMHAHSHCRLNDSDLCTSTDTAVVTSKWHTLLLCCHVLQVADRTAQMHVPDVMSRLARVLSTQT